MKLKKDYDILKPKAPIGVIVKACVLEQGNHYALSFVRMQQLATMREMSNSDSGEKLLGMPHCISVDEETGYLHLFPATNKTREVEIFYHPPIARM